MRKQLLLIAGFLMVLIPAHVYAQSTPPPPDCVQTFTFSASGSWGTFDNRSLGCTTWTVVYQVGNVGGSISSVSLLFQSADGSTTPGSFSNYAGTTSTGANPATSATGEVSTFTNGTVVTPWVRLTLTLSATGTTTINGVLYGYKTGYPGGGGGGGGTSCTSMAPCPVIGVTAAGSAVTEPPVGTGAKDTAGNVENIKSDVNGSLLQGAYPTLAALSLSASGLTVLVTHSASLTTTVAHYSVAFASAVNFQLEYGTGSTCGTGTTALTGVYQSVAGIAIDTPFIVPAGKDLCANLGSSVTGGGVIVYSQP